MMWVYSQSTGELTHGGNLIGTGYAGRGVGCNNPAMQHVSRIGPLPRGFYTIGPAYQHPKLGPCVMNLEPDASNEMFGRSLFRIHGDNKNHDASLGCMVQGPAQRKLVSTSSDRRLQVIE